MRKHFTKLFLCISILLVTLSVNAQSTANYVFATNNNGSLTLDMNSNAIDMSTGTTQIIGPGLDASVGTGLTNIGFDFFLMGTRFTQFSVNEDAVFQLGGTVVGTNIYTITGGTLALPRLAAFNADLRTGTTTGKVHYKLVGSAPNRTLVVEFTDMQLFYTGTAAAGTSTFQIRLYETSGVVENVYGAMNASDISTANRAPSIGFYTGSATNSFISVAHATHTASVTTPYAANPNIASTGNITDLHSAANGNRRYYRFTPLATTTPTGLNFTAITGTSMSLNWTDAASDELGYAIYRSTDNINFTYVTTTLANAITYAATGLSFGTTYYWRVIAVRENIGTALSGSQATTAGTLSGTKTIGTGGDYNNLTDAFAAINTSGLSGNITLQLITGYPAAAETYPIASSNNSVGANTVTIYPTVSGLSITSANATGTLNFNNATNITIDGRVNATGTTKDLIIENTNVAGYAVQFINDATANTIKYCINRSVNTTTTSGTLLFSTTTGTLGNSNNLIDNCDIRDGASTPTNGIYSAGTTAYPNNNNTISNNNIFNFYNSTSTSNGGVGINQSTNNNNWTINANSFYQTSTRTTFGAGATFNAILVSSSTVNGTIITNNFIGGTAPSCGSTALTLNTTATLVFRGIQITAGSATATSIQGNTIQNIAITTASVSTAQSLISAVTGSINIGTTIGNTLGSQSIANSVTFTQSTTSTASFFSGILAGTGTAAIVNINNNTIGGITISNSSTGSVIGRGIHFQGSTGSFTVSNNTIGSTSVTNSFNNTTNGTNYAIAGLGSLTTFVHTISNNTIVNFSNTSASANTGGQVIGILASGSSGGAYAVSGNTIRNLSSTTANIGTTSSASVIGLSYTAATTGGATVSQNTIYALSNSHVSAAALITGLYYAGATSGTNVVSKNLIYNLSGNSANTAAVISGIQVGAGTTTYQNNMVRLGYDIAGSAIIAGCAINGINEPLGTDNFYFNSVYVGATGVGGSNATYAFNSQQTTNTRIFQNNIFHNARSNGAGTGKHYAVRVGGTAANPTGLTINYNDYIANGTGGVFGFFNSLDVADLAAWRVAVGQDGNSFNSDPQFINATGVTPDLHIHASNPTPIESAGLLIGSITDDFDGQTRSGLTPTDIGADAGNFVGLDLSGPIMNFTALSNTLLTSDRTIVVTITDPGSGVATGGNAPRIYYRKNAGGWTNANATSISGNDYTFTISAAPTVGDLIEYYFAAQDLAGTPNLSTSPSGGSGINPPGTTAPSTFNSYTVGGSYTWNGGATASWVAAGSWTPNRTTATAADYIIFNNGGNITVTDIPTQTISNLALSNNTTVQLTSIATATLTLSGNGEVLNIGSGSTLNISSTNALTLAFAGTNPTGTVNGVIGTSGVDPTYPNIINVTGTVLTVNGTFKNGGTITGGSATTLVFATNSTYEHTRNAGTVPITSINANPSNVNLTYTGTVGSLASPPTSCKNFTYNCPSQTLVGATFASILTTISGTFTMVSTGTGTFQFGTAATTQIAGASNIQGGTIRFAGTSGAGIGFNGGLTIQSGATMATTSSSTISATDITINAGGTINTSSTFALTTNCTGNLNNAGTIDGTGTGGILLNFTGTGAQSLTNSNVMSNKVNVTVNKASGVFTLASDHTVNSTASITMTLGSMNIAAGKTLTIATGGTATFSDKSVTLKSDATGTARIATIAGTFNTATNVTTERYIPGKRAYRFLGHPFSTVVPLSQLTTTMDITGGAGASPFTNTTTNNPSAFWYNNATGTGGANDPGFTAFDVASSTTAWTQYRGITLMVRGAKGEGLNGLAYTPSATTLSMSGTLNAVSPVITLAKSAGSEYNLISNPLPSQIDLNLTTRGSAVGANFWVWDATAAGTNGRGAYVSAPFSASYILPMNSAFFTTTTDNAANNTITFPESCKSNGTAVSLFRGQSKFGANSLQLELVNTQGEFYDRFLVFFKDDGKAKATVDYWDAAKLKNADANFYTLSQEGSLLSIDARPLLQNEDLVIPVVLESASVLKYKIRVADFDMEDNRDLYLHDKFLNTWTTIEVGMEYEVNITSDPASKGNRFELVMYKAPPTPPITKLTVTVGPNPSTDFVQVKMQAPKAEITSLRIVGVDGKTVESMNLGSVDQINKQISVKRFVSGTYLLQVIHGAEVVTEKIIKQ